MKNDSLVKKKKSKPFHMKFFIMDVVYSWTHEEEWRKGNILVLSGNSDYLSSMCQTVLCAGDFV